MLEGVISIVEGLNPKLIGIKLEADARTLATLQESPGPSLGVGDGGPAARSGRACLAALGPRASARTKPGAPREPPVELKDTTLAHGSAEGQRALQVTHAAGCGGSCLAIDLRTKRSRSTLS
ncbi:MAG: hypothetical protein DMG57_12980 [Acidobacteria bacterium]|nr:MAG: hypothetical protein DMG57_12980 [Acidobacteriota bacterium]